MRRWREARPAGDSALLLDFGDDVSEPVNEWVHETFETVMLAQLPGVVGLIPAFSSLLVEYEPWATDYGELLVRLEGLTFESRRRAARRVVDVPVWYSGASGPDLVESARILGLSPDELVALHTAQPYRIYCVGFSPGFPLAGLLPPSLRVPRRAEPRTKVPKGSVAIAGSQTGIYPASTPGGWHLIGRTPMELFDWEGDPPCVYSPGDFIKFYAISESEFHEWPRTAARRAGESLP